MGAYGENDLVLVTGTAFTRTFTYTRNGEPGVWTVYDVRMQLRDYNDQLLVELTPFLSKSGSDLILSLPADFTDELPKESWWDLLAINPDDSDDTIRMPRPPGRLLVLQGVTQRD